MSCSGLQGFAVALLPGVTQKLSLLPQKGRPMRITYRGALYTVTTDGELLTLLAALALLDQLAA
jgi:hypothetical protein